MKWGAEKEDEEGGRIMGILQTDDVSLSTIVFFAVLSVLPSGYRWEGEGGEGRLGLQEEIMRNEGMGMVDYMRSAIAII